MIERGRIVKASAGRDREEGFFAAVGERDGYVLICDGRRRRLEQPKKKNPRHLLETDDSIPAEGMRTNRALRRALAAYTASRIPTAD